MAFDVSAISAYVENADFPIVGKIQVSPEMTAAGVTLITGVKGSTKIHFLETTTTWSSGGGCSRPTAADTTTRTDKTLMVGRIALTEDLCIDNLVAKWDQTLMKDGLLAGKQTMPEEFAKIYWDEKSKLLAQDVELADWQGDTGSVSGKLNKYQGWISHIDAGSPVDGNTSNETSVSLSNIVTIMRNMYLAIPNNLKFRDDLVCYMPYTWFQMYQQALLAANLFHFTGGEQEYTIIGTSVKLKPTYGLTAGTLSTYGRMFLTYPSNLVVGLDLASDQNFTVRVDPISNKQLLVDCEFSRGTQVYFTEDIVEFTIHGS